MSKKTYKKPSMKVIELESTDILAGSNEPQVLGLFDEEPNYQDPDTQSGYQW